MILYHYTTGIGAIGIFDSKKLHCSNVLFLNDPKELTYFEDILKEVAEKNEKCYEIYKKFYSKELMAFVFPNEMFVTSFSKNRDSLSMWNYYSKGNGYNIGLDIDKIITKNLKDGNKVIIKSEIVYNKEKQIDLTEKYILSYEKQLDKIEKLLEKANLENDDNILEQCMSEINNIEHDFTFGMFEFMIKFKHQCYENEEEIRLIITMESQRQLNNFKISKNGVFIEYATIDLENEHIKDVTTHPLSGELHYKGIKKYLNSRFGVGKVKVFKSEIPFRIV